MRKSYEALALFDKALQYAQRAYFIYIKEFSEGDEKTKNVKEKMKELKGKIDKNVKKKTMNSSTKAKK